MRSPHLSKWLSLALAVFLLLAVVPLFAAPPGPALPDQANPRRQADALARLTADAGGDVQVSFKRGLGTASFINLPRTDRGLSLPGEAPAERSLAFFAEYADLFGIDDARAELLLSDTLVDLTGGQHLGFVQTEYGVPVFGGELRAHFDRAGRLLGVNGAFVPDIAVDAHPTLSAGQAGQVALDAVAAGMKVQGAAPPAVSKADLVIYRTGLVQGVSGTSYLAYHVEVSNHADVREFLFIDAHSGAILDRFSGIHETLHRELYEMHLTPADLVWQEGDPFPTGNADWNNEINGAGETYNLFGSMTNGEWLSYNDADAIMKTVNNDPGISCPNANWNGVSTNYCTDVSGDDTVAHEWGHAYTEYTHNLIYAWQPGALNESYSDIWGEVVDLINARGQDSPGGLRSLDGSKCSSLDNAAKPNNLKKDNTWRWLSGEDDPAFGGPIRDLWRPECHGSLPNGDPGKVTAAGYQCSSSDGGGVHTNSGVPNHGFALLVDGGTYNSQTITGIGLTKAAHIYWQAQRYYQTNITDFQNHADSLVLACAALIGTPLFELKTTATGWGATTPAITQTDCDQLDKVALAVQFRTAPNCTFTPMFDPNAPALCTAPGEGPQNHLFQDFENGLTGWTTQQAPVNPTTWTDRPWTTVTNAPDGHPGFTAFGPNPAVGDCSNDLENGVTSLLSPVISIPTGVNTPIKMAWDHLVSMELEYDGGNLKASVNGGAFTLVPASAFTFNDYSGTLATSNNDNPMAGQAAWTGGDVGAVSSQWGQSQLDLSQISVDPGDTVQFRWDVGSDGCNGWDGWYVDDVRVYSCAPCTTPGAPTGLNIDQPNLTSVTLNWTAATGATQYEVWTAENAMYFDPTSKSCTNPAPYACTVVSGTTYNAADLGDPAITHSYLVRSANACGQTSVVSNRVAEFEFSLLQGK